jgi:hypothetical protein
MAVNDVILASKYNSIQSKISGVLSVYGQGSYSSQVGTTIISEAQWDNLRYDLTRAHRHIFGYTPSLTDISGSSSMLVRWSHAVEYDLIADTVVGSQYSVYSGATGGQYTQQAALVASDTTFLGTGWNTYKDVTKNITWANASQAAQFFNLGGVINVLSGYTGAGSNTNDTGWANLAISMNNRISASRTDYVAQTALTTGNVYDTTSPYTSNYAIIQLTYVNAYTYQFYAKYNDVKVSANTNPAWQVDEPVNINIYTGVNFLNCQGGEFSAVLPTVTAG